MLFSFKGSEIGNEITMMCLPAVTVLESINIPSLCVFESFPLLPLPVCSTIPESIFLLIAFVNHLCSRSADEKLVSTNLRCCDRPHFGFHMRPYLL